MSTTLTEATVPQAHKRGLRARSAALGLLAASFTAVCLPVLAQPAHAYTITQSTMAVRPTVYQVEGRHYDSGSAVTGPMLRPWIFQTGPVVYRTSPSSGTEYIKVTYTVQRWNGSAWANYYTASSNVTIPSSLTSAQAGALSFLPNAGAGYYYVKVQITSTDSIGAVRGSFSAAMNQSGDYRCNTTRPCSVGNGYVYVGS